MSWRSRRRVTVTGERARREFGFEAQVPLADGLRRTVDWYLSEGLGATRHAA